jgi:hypothetical protein
VLDAARQLSLLDADEYPTGPASEISGPDEMYIPTSQIRIERDPAAPWHRRGAIATKTACGLTYAAAFTREYELRGSLCEHCFTSHERWLVDHPEDLES